MCVLDPEEELLIKGKLLSQDGSDPEYPRADYFHFRFRLAIDTLVVSPVYIADLVDLGQM